MYTPFWMGYVAWESKQEVTMLSSYRKKMVCTPYTFKFSRIQVLLGALTSIDKSGLYGLSSRPMVGSQQEQHNVILLSNCPSRFSTLPLSTQMSRYATPQPIPSQTLYNVSIFMSCHLKVDPGLTCRTNLCKNQSVSNVT